MRQVLTMLLVVFGAVVLAGCSEEQPIMNVPQQVAYNDCMKDRWSGAADTLWFGPLGWAYHSSVAKDCLAKSGSMGESEVGTQSTSAASPASGYPSVAVPAPSTH